MEGEILTFLSTVHELIVGSIIRIMEGETLHSPPKSTIIDEATALPIELGTYHVSEIQICEMGSHGPHDEYVCVGAINF